MKSGLQVPCADLPLEHHEDPIGGEDGSIRLNFVARPISLSGTVLSDPREGKAATLANCSHDGGTWLLRTRVWAPDGKVIAGVDKEISVQSPIKISYEFKPSGNGQGTLPAITLEHPPADGYWKATPNDPSHQFAISGQPYRWTLNAPNANASRLKAIFADGVSYPLGEALDRGEGCSAWQICHLHKAANDPPYPSPLVCPDMIPPCVSGAKRCDALPPRLLVK